jgi:hypothetical protein
VSEKGNKEDRRMKSASSSIEEKSKEREQMKGETRGK